MLEHIEKLVKRGFAVHLLKKKSKSPANAEWSTAPVLTYAQLKQQYKPGMNVGVRLGKWSEVCGYYLHVVDLDIRDPKLADEAHEALESIFPDYAEYPCVMSGSGGESRHYYFLTSKPLRSLKLAHADTFTMVHDKRLGREVKKWDWEIELFGTGKQVVIPPSIHDVTGKPYVWLKQFDFMEILAEEGGPIPDEDIIAAINAVDDDAKYDPADPRYAPLGLELDELEADIKKLPQDDWLEDRDGWLRLGMAIHHETGGSKDGYDLWCDHSRLSKKFDAKDSKRVWKSFKNRHRPFRWASIKSVVRDIELEAMLDDDVFENLEDDMDLDRPKKKLTADDLLGDIGDSDDIEYEDLSHIPDIGEEFTGTKRSIKIKKAEVEAELGVKVPKKIARLNRQHAVARVNGKTVIITEHKDGRVAFSGVNDFNNYYENDRVSSEKSTIPVSKAWLQNKQRRNYPEGIVFEPKNTDPDYYNLWRGWSIEPDKSGSCELFLDHVKNIICRGDDKLYRYMIGWLAHMIQRPEDKPGVAVVYRGKKGAGKDTVAEYVSGMMKHHYMMISQPEHLVGRFNAHQQSLMLLHVEEGYWAGSKQAEGPLKSVITSPTVTIEHKGVNAFSINSVLRILMSSNERWVVPASGPDERRYFVVDVDDAWARSGRLGRDPVKRKRYFDAIRHEMTHGGREALLAYLMEYDLTDFDVRDPPDTAALDEQKLAGLKNVDLWWADQLMEGELKFDIMQLSAAHFYEWSRENVMALTDLIYESYEAWFRKQRYQGDMLSEIAFFLKLKELTDGQLARSRRRVNGERKYTTEIPKLSICRKAFDKAFGTKLDWKMYEIEEADPLIGDDMDEEI